MFARITVLLPFLALLAKAITVTSPTEGQNWGTTGAQTVSWSSVESDPSSFTVLLVNDVSVLNASQPVSPPGVSLRGTTAYLSAASRANLDFRFTFSSACRGTNPSKTSS